MAVGKLAVDAEGRVHGSNVSWNQPWPCINGNPGGMTLPSGCMGMLVHTMVGNLQPGTVSWFNNSAAQASAHFGVDQEGGIWQFGPVNGWMAWHCAEGNPHFFGVEFADAGQPSSPLTEAQIAAGAQLLELLSRDDVGRFPMQLSDSPSTEGLGWHGMGGAAFGGHFDCPGDVRKAQRPQIIAEAVAIRGGPKPAAPAKAPTAPSVRQWTTAGMESLAQLAAQQHTEPSTVLRMTAEHSPGSVYPAEVAAWLNQVFAGQVSPTAKMPAGLKLYLPG